MLTKTTVFLAFRPPQHAEPSPAFGALQIDEIFVRKLQDARRAMHTCDGRMMMMDRLCPVTWSATDSGGLAATPPKSTTLSVTRGGDVMIRAFTRNGQELEGHFLQLVDLENALESARAGDLTPFVVNDDGHDEEDDASMLAPFFPDLAEQLKGDRAETPRG